VNSLISLTSPEPELDEAQRIQHAKIKRDTMIALICACVGAALCFLFVFQILALVFAIRALWRIEQTGLGTECRMRAIVSILIAIVALIIILMLILNPDMRLNWPT
jgi:hypothetical protein